MNWLLLTIVVLGTGFSAGFFVKHYYRRTGWGILAAVTVLALAVVGGAAVCWDAPANEELEPDYALLLGCGLEDGQATDELIRRCETALGWLEENPGGLLVVSGGDPKGQGITEAAVMAAWLRNHGADETQIVREDRANDTRQNLLYSKTLVHKLERETDTVLLITSEYHQTRARFLARQNGQQALSLSCETPFFDHLQAAVREVYSFVKAFFETL